MAIDRNRTAELIREIDSLFDTLTETLSEKVKKSFKEKVMGPAYQEISELIGESRPPVLFLLGRSGHGKSSLINALANKYAAEVGHIKPVNRETVRHVISFEEKFSSWEVLDSRGIFEVTAPPGATSESAVEVLKRDLLKYKPDVILHVVTASETRALEKDMEVLREISELYSQHNLHIPPAMAVLTKADALGNPMDWPPAKFPVKAGQIQDVVFYMVSDIIRAKEIKPLDLNYHYRGYRVDSDAYLAVIPVCTLAEEEDRWNIEILSEYICDQLPKSARLSFAQAQNRKTLLREISSSLIKRFAGIATSIGATPIPVADMAILIPLQTLMIATIGGLSCRTLSKETATEFLTASGISLTTAFGAREFVRWVSEGLGPGPAAVISGATAGTVTYGIGKSAEAYFFQGEVKRPEEFKEG